MVVRAFRQTDPPPEDPAFSQNLDLAYPLHRPAVLLASGGPSSSFTGRRPVLVASLCSSGGAPCTIPCLRPCRRGGCGYPSSVDGWLQVHGMAWTCVIQPMDTVNLQKEVQSAARGYPALDLKKKSRRRIKVVGEEKPTSTSTVFTLRDGGRTEGLKYIVTSYKEPTLSLFTKIGT